MVIYPVWSRRARQALEFDAKSYMRILINVLRNDDERAVLEDAGVAETAELLLLNLRDLDQFQSFKNLRDAKPQEVMDVFGKISEDSPKVFSILRGDDFPARVERLKAAQAEAAMRRREKELRKEEAVQLKMLADKKKRQREEARREHERRLWLAKALEQEENHRLHADRAANLRAQRLELQQEKEARRLEQEEIVDEAMHLGERAWQAAERLAAEYLREHGYPDAQVTPPGNDKGLDVVGRAVAGQVKYLSRPVGAPMLQQAVGASGGREVVFFSRNGYSPAAVEYAAAEEIALFTVELPDTVKPTNRHGRLISEQG